MRRRFNWAILVVIPALLVAWTIAIGGLAVVVAVITALLKGVLHG